MKALVYDSGTLLEAAGAAFGVDVDAFAPYANEGRGKTAAVKAWQELVDAAMYFYRNYQDGESYAKAIRYLASNVSENAWFCDCRGCA